MAPLMSGLSPKSLYFNRHVSTNEHNSVLAFFALIFEMHCSHISSLVMEPRLKMLALGSGYLFNYSMGLSDDEMIGYRGENKDELVFTITTYSPRKSSTVIIPTLHMSLL